MLIESYRHKPEDLAIWSELVIADQSRSRRIGNLESKAKSAIESFPVDYVAVSWGKDSVVLAHLFWSVSEVLLHHLRPTNHNPDCDLVRDAYLSRFGQRYEELPVDYSDVDRTANHDDVDKATDSKWYAAIRETKQRIGNRYATGIRSEESAGRWMRAIRFGVQSENALAPLIHWKNADIFAYLSKYDLPIHPAYACLGGGRWPREKIRVAEIGDTHGGFHGRYEWEFEYYPEESRRVRCSSKLPQS